MMGNGRKETEAQRNEFVTVRRGNSKRPHASRYTFYDQRVPALRSPVLLDAHLKRRSWLTSSTLVVEKWSSMRLRKTEKRPSKAYGSP